MSLLSQCQNRIVGSGPKLELSRVRLEGGGGFSCKNGAGGTVQKWNIRKCEEDEIKGIQKWSRKFRDILVLVYTIFPPVLC